MSLLGYYRTIIPAPMGGGGYIYHFPLYYIQILIIFFSFHICFDSLLSEGAQFSSCWEHFWGENLQPAGVHTSVKCKRWQGGQLTAKEIFTVTERSHTAVVSLSPELMSVEGGRSAERT